MRWVAGSIGPTSKSLSMSQGIDDPTAEKVDWDALVATYTDQMEALIEGGVDALLIETIFDGLNAKRANKTLTTRRRYMPHVVRWSGWDAGCH